MEKIIRIKGREIESKRNNTKFIAWKVKEKSGEWVRAKFTKAVKNLPKIEGHYDMKVNTEDMNCSNDDFGKVWWFNNVIEFAEPTVDTKQADENF